MLFGVAVSRIIWIQNVTDQKLLKNIPSGVYDDICRELATILKQKTRFRERLDLAIVFKLYLAICYQLTGANV